MVVMTSLTLNTTDPHVARDLADIQEMHRTVMRLVTGGRHVDTTAATSNTNADSPAGAIRAAAGVLYRLTHGATGNELLIQSQKPLHSESLDPNYASSVRTLDLSPLLERIENGSTVRYTLVAAPVMSLSRRDTEGNRLRGKKVPLRSRDEATTWWENQMPRHGLKTLIPDNGIPALAVDQVEAQSGDRRSHGRTDKVQHRPYRITGIARVADRDALLSAVASGIGPGKAHGFGLLTVLPTSA